MIISLCNLNVYCRNDLRPFPKYVYIGIRSHPFKNLNLDNVAISGKIVNCGHPWLKFVNIFIIKNHERNSIIKISYYYWSTEKDINCVYLKFSCKYKEFFLLYQRRNMSKKQGKLTFWFIIVNKIKSLKHFRLTSNISRYLISNPVIVVF